MPNINEDVQKNPWSIVSHWSTRVHATDDHSLGLVIQSTHFSVLLIQLIHQQFVYEDLTGDSVKGLSEVQVDDICCSPLIYQASHFIMEVKQIA